MNCPICKHKKSTVIYSNPSVPAFQNKVYDTKKEALNCQCVPVELAQCTRCGFVWNHRFHAEVMDYDASYQNEQGLSPAFQHHMGETIDFISGFFAPPADIIEVGCGKGTFLSMVRNAGFKASGYDPAYEGDDPNVKKQYFDTSLELVPGDLVILRHTLEHIPFPLAFLQDIKRANHDQGKIFIEVPSLEWIAENRAFWDIFHEHCNYFTETALVALFPNATIKRCFGDQYIWLMADLSELTDGTHALTASIERKQLVDPSVFMNEIKLLRNFITEHPGCMIWGAGAKGIALANQADPKGSLIKGIIDINPKKQGHFAPKTGHSILSPNEIEKQGTGDIIIMNANYAEEIRTMCEGLPNTLFTMGHI